MTNEVSKGEIVYANLELEDEIIVNKKIEVKKYKVYEVVYKFTDGFYDNLRELKKIKVNKPLKVTKIEVLARLGFEIKY